MPFAGLRTGSRSFGVIAIVLGCMSGCTVLSLPFAWLAPRSPSSPQLRPGQLIGSALVMLALAAALVWFGVGAWRLRRWARPLAVTGGTLWLLGGVMSLIAMAFTFPNQRAAMHRGPAAASLPPGADWAILGFTIALLVIFGIVLPGLYVWFYKKPGAGQMLEYYDPQPRWTDGSPLPVLGLTVALALLGISHVLTAPVAVDAIFGMMLFGLPAAALMLVEGAVSSVLAWLVFQRRPAGWWGSLVLAVIWTVSSAAMLVHPHQTIEMYHHAGFNDQEIAAMNGAGTGAAQLAAGIPTMLFVFGYLFYVRRYFVPVVEP